jgi:hypothetical protein
MTSKIGLTAIFLALSLTSVSAGGRLDLGEWDASKPFLITGILSSASILVIQDGLYFTCQLDDQGKFVDLLQCKPILTAGLRQQISTVEATAAALEAAAAKAAAAAEAAASSDSLDDALANATDTTDTSAADQAEIDAALADEPATAPESLQTGSGGTSDQPTGAVLNSGELDNLRQIIGPFWNIGSLSTEATRVTVTMRVQVSQDQKILSVEMVEFTGGTAEAAQQAFAAARRAVIRGASKGLGLPPDEYDTWKSMLITFDTSKGEIR